MKQKELRNAVKWSVCSVGMGPVVQVRTVPAVMEIITLLAMHSWLELKMT